MKTHSLRCAVIAGLLAMLNSCANDDGPSAPAADSPTAKFTIAVPGPGTALSRSAAEAEVTDEGFDYEYAVNNVMLVIYEKSLTDTLTADDKVTAVITATNPTGPTDNGIYKKYSFETKLSEGLTAGKEYNAVAIANYSGRITDISKSTTLTDLRDYVVTSELYTGTTYSPSDFLMSSYDEVKFKVTSTDGSFDIDDNDHIIPVQRLAARIELNFADTYTTTTDGSYVFPIYDKDLTTLISGAEFTLTEVGLTNMLSSSSPQYLFQRSGENSGYFCNEDKFTNGMPVNTIVCPGGGKYDNDWTAEIADIFNTAKTKKNGDYYILGYARENNSDSYPTSITLTGTSTLVNGHLTASAPSRDDTDTHTTLTASIPLRYGTASGAPACIVRNTIYRLSVRFYASGDAVYVIWYYDSDNSGTFDTLETATFHQYILESDGTAPKD